MRKHVIKLSLSLFAFGITNLFYAQDIDKDVLNWYNGNGTGMQTEKAYKKLKDRETKTVVVAIIDSGVDIEHEDLQGKIWVNTDEIPNNGIDDDKNGYVDDVHGWNFLGNKNGENAHAMRLERTRQLAKMYDKFSGVDASTLSPEEKAEYALYEKMTLELEEEASYYSRGAQYYGMVSAMIDETPEMLNEILGKREATQKEVEAKMKELSKEISSLDKSYEKDEDPVTLKKLEETVNNFDKLEFVLSVMTGKLSQKKMDDRAKSYQKMVETHHNIEFDGREIVGDDPDDFTDTDVKFPCLFDSISNFNA